MHTPELFRHCAPQKSGDDSVIFYKQIKLVKNCNYTKSVFSGFKADAITRKEITIISMNNYNTTYTDLLIREIRATPDEYLPNLSDIVRIFRESIYIKNQIPRLTYRSSASLQGAVTGYLKREIRRNAND